MKKFLILFLLFFILSPVTFAVDYNLNHTFFNSNIRGIKSLLNYQIKSANKMNFEKFISTYDPQYKNADGYDMVLYSNLVKELWQNYNNIKYNIKIKNISINDDGIAQVLLVETSHADIPGSNEMSGVLHSEANSIYYLKKINGRWKVTSDKILNEVTSMLYGDALDLDIKLSAPLEVRPGEEYTASLEFVPPKDTFAVASIAKDKVEYPQKQAKEVFRKMPDDNILERLFVANTENANEYIMASIGLTKPNIKDLSIQLNLTGFGYQIIRVNVVDDKKEDVDVQKE